ncbi:MAG: hypothetical protein GEU93_13325 [Propionibacteriales bacterium]|nr:hypothetical protein [Propionibacteriales bacterium]
MEFLLWFGAVLRLARRDSDLSQRQLARWSGVPKSTIADAECARGRINLLSAMELLACLGYDLRIIDRSGHEVPAFLMDQRRDCVGRRFPAHLDLIPKGDDLVEWEERERARDPRYRQCPQPSRWTYRLNRLARDLDRMDGFFGELGTHPHPPPMLAVDELIALRPSLAYHRGEPIRELRRPWTLDPNAPSGLGPRVRRLWAVGRSP